jgi:hypothetical protein
MDSRNLNFKQADYKISELIYELIRSHADADAIAELRAGQRHLREPSVRRDIVEESLVKPLRKLERVPWARIRGTASECLNLLPRTAAFYQSQPSKR